MSDKDRLFDAMIVKGDVRLAKRLIRKGADVNARDASGETFLHSAVCFGEDEFVNLCLESGAEVDAMSREGLTPLALAESAGNERLIDILIRAGANASLVKKLEDVDLSGVETVMTPGMKIIVQNEFGTMTIEAGRGTKRLYSWEGVTRWAYLDPRGSRWFGSLGLYYPGLGNHWVEHNGISRGVLDEGQMHFPNMEDARKWLNALPTYCISYVSRADGLVVGWGKELGRNQLEVEVWQVLLNGKNPSDFPVSTNGTITVVANGGCVQSEDTQLNK